MEATTFTPEDWANHEKFVQMFRAAKCSQGVCPPVLTLCGEFCLLYKNFPV